MAKFKFLFTIFLTLVLQQAFSATQRGGESNTANHQIINQTNINEDDSTLNIFGEILPEVIEITVHSSSGECFFTNFKTKTAFTVLINTFQKSNLLPRRRIVESDTCHPIASIPIYLQIRTFLL